jgi:thiamine-phosphate pyrophosphorylase
MPKLPVSKDQSNNFDRNLVYRILDANLDRAREGLRVIEEYCRFGLENAALSQECKDLRQQLATWHSEQFREARDTSHDPGVNLGHPQEESRTDLKALLRANLGRVQEALRVVEEYGKLISQKDLDSDWNLDLASGAKSLRYRLYILESKLFARPENLPENHQENLQENCRENRLKKLLQARLYLVTMPIANLLEVVESALQGGLGLVQFRQKEGNDRDRFETASALCQLCHRYDALFLVNDRVDIALAVGADGIHLGQTDLPVSVVRSLMGSDAIIGLSTTCAAELEIALNSKVDYVGVGPVFATPTKPGKAASGFEYVSYAATNLSMPWYAIGGVDQENLNDVMNAGASRVAVVRSLINAPDPKQATENFLTKLNQN